MIEVEKLFVQAGDFSINDISLSIDTGSYVALMGKTGCGKTTLLEAICGLKPIVKGSIRLMGKEVGRLRPGERGIGFVPQDLALFPTMTVRDHLAFSLFIRKWNKVDINERVQEVADWLGIAPLLNRKPMGLSGGEKQRVALGRALSFKPDVLCLDEPLSALDDDTREEMFEVFKMVREQSEVTTLHITHNLEESKKLADRLIRFEEGVLTEVKL